MKIEVRFENGEIYHIPAEVIAKMRTEYYAEKDGFLPESQEWKEEFEQSMDSYELKDWIQNNCNWSDVRDYALLQPKGVQPFDYDSEFVSADISIIK